MEKKKNQILKSVWKKTDVDMDSVNWKGKQIHLKSVPALKNMETGKICVYPEDVSKAELRDIANEVGVKSTDIPLFLIMGAEVSGIIQPGYLHHRYRLNKMLFYQWKRLEKEGLGSAFEHDNFVADDRGPVPEHLEEDIERLKKEGLVKVSMEKWGPRPTDSSKTTKLTPKGLQIASKISNTVAEPFLKVSNEVKKELFPLTPTEIRKRVHSNYPEYKKVYKKNDSV